MTGHIQGQTWRGQCCTRIHPLKADGVLQAAPMITDAQRRETLLDLMEASLRPKSAAPNLGMDLIQPMKPSPQQEVCLPLSSDHQDQCIGSRMI